ncbi:hypothetical protein NON00_09745 [Roseomonas sp. GC11]|uniref:hypothetical protein n=1 Tax=Roseomonas sp. GC11 TaxID=2950546 RepID=UPI00210B16E2|nr:hypothetical protein [Roseomonas sp. GC11]MCQ4160210.1 hypothetical protein [Roseomonas sp. GC11]
MPFSPPAHSSQAHSSIVCDHDWLSHMRSRPQILGEFAEALPGQGDLVMEEAAARAWPGHGGRALDHFEAALDEMEAGFTAIAEAEDAYRAAMEHWLAQQCLTWTTLAAAWVGALLSPRRREDYRRLVALRQTQPLSDREAAAAFRKARAEADARIQQGGRLAATWAVQAALALVLTGRTPSGPLAEAVQAYDAAVTRRAMLRHRIVVSAMGVSQTFPFEITPPPPPARRPRLAWPAELGSMGIPSRVEDPLRIAVSVRADGLSWEGGDVCVLELGEWEVAMPLSEAGSARMLGLISKFNNFRSVRGREDTMVLGYDVPKGVESMRLTRHMRNWQAEQWGLTVDLRYEKLPREKAPKGANAAGNAPGTSSGNSPGDSLAAGAPSRG